MTSGVYKVSDVHNKKELYNFLCKTFPDLKDTRPGVYEEFHWVGEMPIPNEFDSICILTLKTTPFENIYPFTRKQLIDKAFYSKNTSEFLTDKYGKPSTEIMQMKRDLVSALIYMVKPISSFVFGLYMDGMTIGKVGKSDIKVDISSDYNPDIRYVSIINHDKKEAKMLFKEMRHKMFPTPKEGYEKGGDFKKYLLKSGISSNDIER